MPVTTTATLEAKAGASATITVGGSIVTVTWSTSPADAGGAIILAAAELSQAQKAAAANKGLMLTNISFTLSPSGSPTAQPQISVSYTSSQIAGIDEKSISLYLYDGGPPSWTPLTACKSNAEERLISCKVPASGSFVVAGDRPVKSAVGLFDSSPRPVVTSPIALSIAAIAAFALFGAALFYKRRIRAS